MPKFEDYNWDYADECLLNAYKKKIESVKKLDKELKVTTHENCYCLPLKSVHNSRIFLDGGILDSDLNFIEEAKILPNRIYSGYDFNKDKVIYDDREVIFAGHFWPHWGHFILEEVSRLWYFLEEQESKLPIIYLSPVELSGNYLEFFELLGIDTKRLVWVNQLTQFKKIHIPEVSVVVMNYYTDKYKKIFDKVKSAVSTNKKCPEKIFFTRKNFEKSYSVDFGAIREIEDFFEQNGYTMISPETLTLTEQIELLKSCKNFATVAGTLPHNLLFANENINVIIINKSYVLNAHQAFIDNIIGIKPTYIDCHISILPQHIGHGPFCYWFSENLIKYATDNNMLYKICDNNKYFELYLKNYFTKIPQLYRYKKKLCYNKIFHDYLKKIEGHFGIKLLLNIIYINPDILKFYPIITKKVPKLITVIKMKLSKV